MRIRRSVQVAAGPDEVRSVLAEAEAFARCLPGATPDSAAGDSVEGRFTVRIGGHQITYVGEANCSDGQSLLWRGTAAQVRGEGEVTASLSFTAQADAGGSTLAVDARFTGTGRVADFEADERRAAGERLLERLLQAIALEVARSAAPAPASIEPVEAPGPAAPATRTPVADEARPPAPAGANGHSAVEVFRPLGTTPVVAALVASATVALVWLLRRFTVRH